MVWSKVIVAKFQCWFHEYSVNWLTYWLRSLSRTLVPFLQMLCPKPKIKTSKSLLDWKVFILPFILFCVTMNTYCLYLDPFYRSLLKILCSCLQSRSNPSVPSCSLMLPWKYNFFCIQHFWRLTWTVLPGFFLINRRQLIKMNYVFCNKPQLQTLFQVLQSKLEIYVNLSFLD